MAQVEHLMRYKSFHTSILLRMYGDTQQNLGKERPFKFETAWLLEVECEKIVKKVWEDSNECFIEERLKHVADELKGWSNIKFRALNSQAEWSRGIIGECFNEQDAKTILTIPLSERLPKDCISWAFSKDALYYVKSAYMLGNDTEVSTLLWKVCSSILLVIHNLRRRHLIEEDCCPLCKVEPETTFYALFDCLMVQDVWMESGLKDITKHEDGGSPCNWVESLGKVQQKKTAFRGFLKGCSLLCGVSLHAGKVIDTEVSTLLWKVCSSILLVIHNLRQRHLIEEDCCPLCKVEPETTFYALFDCLMVQDVWMESGLKDITKHEDGGSPCNWVESLGKV
ncbi:hypothetical protein RDABS01_024609 [Bienertia sinuspersici]